MEECDVRKINYLAAAAADCLTEGANVEEIRCTLWFVDALRVNVSNILASKLLIPQKKIK